MTKSEMKLRERCYILSEVIKCISSIHRQAETTENQKQLIETMIGAAIWYFPQPNDLWTGYISRDAISLHHPSSGNAKPRLTADHLYPRKIAAAELLGMSWDDHDESENKLYELYVTKYGRFTYITPTENSRLVRFQKSGTFVEPSKAYKDAAIDLVPISMDQLKQVKKRNVEIIDRILHG